MWSLNLSLAYLMPILDQPALADNNLLLTSAMSFRLEQMDFRAVLWSSEFSVICVSVYQPGDL